MKIKNKPFILEHFTEEEIKEEIERCEARDRMYAIGSQSTEQALFSMIREFGIEEALRRCCEDLLADCPRSKDANWYKAEFYKH